MKNNTQKIEGETREELGRKDEEANNIERDDKSDTFEVKNEKVYFSEEYATSFSEELGRNNSEARDKDNFYL